MTASEIIEVFGGRVEIAVLTGAKPNAITQWRKGGVPPLYWHVLVAEADRRRADDAQFPSITFEILAASKPASEARNDAPVHPDRRMVRAEQAA